jgi:hypothetical protein
LFSILKSRVRIHIEITCGYEKLLEVPDQKTTYREYLPLFSILCEMTLMLGNMM